MSQPPLGMNSFHSVCLLSEDEEAEMWMDDSRVEEETDDIGWISDAYSDDNFWYDPDQRTTSVSSTSAPNEGSEKDFKSSLYHNLTDLQTPRADVRRVVSYDSNQSPTSLFTVHKHSAQNLKTPKLQQGLEDASNPTLSLQNGQWDVPLSGQPSHLVNSSSFGNQTVQGISDLPVGKPMFFSQMNERIIPMNAGGQSATLEQPSRTEVTKNCVSPQFELCELNKEGGMDMSTLIALASYNSLRRAPGMSSLNADKFHLVQPPAKRMKGDTFSSAFTFQMVAPLLPQRSHAAMPSGGKPVMTTTVIPDVKDSEARGTPSQQDANKSQSTSSGSGSTSVLKRKVAMESECLDKGTLKSSHAEPSPSLPAKPLTPYNFFFRFERTRLLKVIREMEADPNSMIENKSDVELLAFLRQNLPKEYYSYRSWTVENSTEQQRQILEDQWGRDTTVKRVHCKSHGRISFGTLSKYIAASWKSLPQTSKDVFREISAQDYRRYNEGKFA